ncbi:hypothetical protein F6455_11340 [Proteobacteria bacterium 005FR1]|nr:hypothetical protein [Proteobacteria bacterium 005FR1]
MEPITAAMITFGSAILLVSWVLLLITSFKEDFTWGLITLLLPPISYIYALFRWSKAKEAILLAALGLLLLILA